MYRIIFSRTHDNPLTGRAAYRVVECYDPIHRLHAIYLRLFHEKFLNNITAHDGGKYGLLSENPKQVGTFINPTRELKKIMGCKP